MAKQPSPKKKMNNIARLSLFWAILIVIVLAIIAISSPQGNLKEVAISNVIQRANSGEITKIEIEGNNVKVTPKGQAEATEKSVKEGGSSI
jgi:hypothetical protein